jgi:cytochrome c peroxidase
MLTVTSQAEMEGQAGENRQADAANNNMLAGEGGDWDIIAKKLQSIPEYVEMFVVAYGDEIFTAEDITFVHAANAIAAFEARQWRFDDSPFDQFLDGDLSALNAEEKQGLKLFYTKAGCGNCHSGVFQTDQEFHAIAMPQIGPGKGDNVTGYLDGLDDFGRERVTGEFYDRYRFRTPTLRNIALSAPYGHAGVYNSLEEMVQHHLDSVESLNHYDQSQAVLTPTYSRLDELDFMVMNDDDRREAIADANELNPIHLQDWELDALLAFLHSLTDLRAVDLRRDVPMSVPSGLPVWD